MAKSEKLIEMLEFINEYPSLTAKDLARLCNVSERGIYRYLNTLSRAGIHVRYQNGGYKLQEDYSEILGKSDPEELELLKAVLSIGVKNCKDDNLIECGKKFIGVINMNLPKPKEKGHSEIEILPRGKEPANIGGTVTIGHSSKPDIINPILTCDTISVNLMNLIFSNLVSFDRNLQPVPDVARHWEISDDGLVWTFYLRDDVKFHDGHPLTIQDVEFTYRAIMDSKNKSAISGRLDLINSIETEGDHIFRVVLNHPFAPFLQRFNRAIAPKHLLENVDIYDTPFNRRPVGSGPFKLTEWTKDDTIVLEANRGYYLSGRPALDRLIFKSYPDRKAALRAIAIGKMDIALDLTAADHLFVSRRGSFRVYSAPGAFYHALIFNLNDPLFRDKRVREAFDYAIDRESIIKNQLKGASRVCTGPFRVNSWAYNPDVEPNPYNVEKAKELFAQAGWRDTDGDGVLDMDGQPLEITLTVPNISDSLERIAVALRAQLMKVGIILKVLYINSPRLSEANFQAVLVKVSAGGDPDYECKFWHSRSKDMNISFYANSFVDDLLEQGRRTVNIEERKAIYHEVHQIIHDDFPAIFLASGSEFIGSNYRFTNANFSSMTYFLTSMKDWQIAGEQKESMAHERQLKLSIS